MHHHKPDSIKDLNTNCKPKRRSPLNTDSRVFVEVDFPKDQQLPNICDVYGDLLDTQKYN